MTAQDRPSHAIAVLAGVTVLLVAVATALLLWETRKHELERARLDTASLAHMFREQTERAFEGADLVLRGVQERMQTAYGSSLPLDGPAVRLLLAARLSGNQHLSALVLLDASGKVVNSSRGDVQAGESMAERPLFRTLASGEYDALYIEKPMRGADGVWSIQLARSFSDVKGRFRGITVLTMTIPRFEHFYAWLKLDYVRPLALYLADGTLIATVPHRENLVGARRPELNWMDLDPSDSRVRLITRAGSDGAQHVYAVAGVPRFPLLVSVTSDDDPALAAWRDQSLPILGGAVLVCVFILVSAALLAREMKRKARLAQALADARERYHRIVDSLLDAIVSVDVAGTITLFNPAAENMFGIPAAEAVGSPLSRLLPEPVRGRHDDYVRHFIEGDGASRGMAPRIETTALRADGTEFPVESTISCTWVDGEPQLTAVLRDVTERKRAETDLRDMNRQLRALSVTLQNVREQERTRIASELHDELGQQLTGLKLELSWLGGRVKGGREATVETVDAMRHQLDTAIGSVRRIATELRPRVLDDRAFDEALAWQAEEFGQRSGLAVELDLPDAARVVDEAMAIALYRIVQESLTNVVRHAAATRVSVSLRREGDELVLRVRDDGAGLPHFRRAAGSGIGLVSMRERAMSLGGTLLISSGDAGGTTVEVRLPLHEHEAAELESA